MKPATESTEKLRGRLASAEETIARIDRGEYTGRPVTQGMPTRNYLAKVRDETRAQLQARGENA